MSPNATNSVSMVFVQWEAPSFGFVRLAVRESAEPEIVQQFRVHNPKFKSQSAQELGQWLSKQLRNNGISQQNLRIVLPRRYASTQLLDLPTSNQQEIADICKLQLKTKATGDRAEVVGDYLRIPSLPVEAGPTNASASATKVFLTSVSNRELQPILEATQEAGVVVDGIHIAEFSLAAADDTKRNGIALQVLRHQERIEFIVCEQGVPLSAQTFPYLDNGDDVASVMPALGGRVLRSLGEDVANRLDQVCLYGQEVTALATHFEDFFGIPIQRNQRHAATHFPIVSLAQCIAGSAPLLNFAAPKTTDAERTRHKLPWQYVVAAAFALIAIGLYAVNQSSQSQLEHLHRQLSQAKKSVDNPAVRNQAVKYRFVTDWQSKSIDWSEQLSKFAVAISVGEKSYLDSLTVNASRGSKSTINAVGHADTPEAVFAMHKAICEQAEFDLNPQAISTAPAKDRFGTKFSLNASSAFPVVTP